MLKSNKTKFIKIMFFLTCKTLLIKFKICYFLFSTNFVKVMSSLPPRLLELEFHLSFRESEAKLVVIKKICVEIVGDRLSLSLTF